MKDLRAVRGMQDLYGLDSYQWNLVESKIKKLFADFGYQEIRTPTLEKKEVFSDSVGGDTDIVQKQMYQVQGDSEETLVLRPEGTAGFMRAFLEHRLYESNRPERFYYYLPMFRHERPQKGRLRQFHQFGAELLLDPTPEADAEIIYFLHHLYQFLGVQEYQIKVNNVGTPQTREAYKTNLREYLKERWDDLCDLCKSRFERSVLRVLDCKNEKCQALVQKAPSILESLDEECRKHLAGVEKRLTHLNVPYEIDPLIVRGLDYYQKTTFEFTSSLLGAQSALTGGGRYDGLSTRFGGKPYPAVGFGLGMERLMLVLQTKQLLPSALEGPFVLLAPLGEAALDYLFPVAFQLKAQGINCHLAYESKNLKQSLKLADKLQATYTLMVGDDELAQKKAILKRMTDGTQETLSLTDIQEEILRRSSK